MADGIGWERHEYRRSDALTVRGEIVVEFVGEISIVRRDRATSIRGFRGVETGG